MTMYFIDAYLFNFKYFFHYICMNRYFIENYLKKNYLRFALIIGFILKIDNSVELSNI